VSFCLVNITQKYMLQNLP